MQKEMGKIEEIEQQFKKGFTNVNEQNSSVENVIITPIARMIGNYYEAMKFITYDEKEDFIKSLCAKSDNKVVNAINNVVNGITGNVIGSLLAPALVKLSQRWAMSLEYETEEDAMRAEARQRLIGEIYDSISK